MKKIYIIVKENKIKTFLLILLLIILGYLIYINKSIIFNWEIFCELYDVHFISIITVINMFVSILSFISGLIKKKGMLVYLSVVTFLAISIFCAFGITVHYRSMFNEKISDILPDTDDYLSWDIPIFVDTSFHSTHERESEEQKPQVIFDMLEESFVQYLQKITGGEIWQNRYYQDYEGNGECQMFAVVEKTADDNRSSAENGYGTLWYVDKYGAVEVDNEVKEYLPGAISFLENGYIFQTFQQYRPDGNTAFVWSVLDGKPYQPAISGMGSDIRVNEFGDIEVVVPGKRSGAETAEEMVYYFYLDDTNTLREYGGREISAGEFERIPGMQDVLAEMYARKCWTQTIYYRENGIININCYKEYGAEVKRYLVTIRHEGSEWQYIHSEDGKEYRAGTCLEALIPSIATYPDKLPY